MGEIIHIKDEVRDKFAIMSELLFTKGDINISFDDVRPLLDSKGPLLMLTGTGSGSDRAIKACDDALSGLGCVFTMRSKVIKMCLHIFGPLDLCLKDVNDVVDTLKHTISPISGETFGVTRNQDYHDKIRVAILVSLKGTDITRKIGSSPDDCDLVYEWADKWLGLIELINNVTSTDKAMQSPPPTEIDELKYQRLRFWFVDHEAQFVPLWKEFYRSHVWAHPRSTNDYEGDLPRRYFENHFLFFYEPENLYELAKHLELQSGTDIWEPSEQTAAMVRPVLVRLGQLMIEFMDWIDEHNTNRNYPV